MSGPGKGRYTDYVPVSSARNTMLTKLFNAKAPNDQATFYGMLDETDNAKAAVAVSSNAASLISAGKGDTSMFPVGVKMNFAGTTAQPVPNLAEVVWGGPGGPANPYVPDVSSPGPGKTSGVDKADKPEITPANIKPNYVPGVAGSGTASPDSTSKDIGTSPIGRDLTLGKSSV